jgi:general secretion pathway protein I
MIRGRRIGGFTLLEVLIALAVLALGMLAVLGAAGTSTRSGAQLRDKTFASWVAMNELTSVRLGCNTSGSDTFNGDADMAGQKWHWEAKTSATSDPDLMRIDIDVSQADSPHDVVTSLVGFMGKRTGPTAPPGSPGNQAAAASGCG